MALTVPVDQHRSWYQFHAPTNDTTNHVDVIAPVGSAVTLDGLTRGAGNASDAGGLRRRQGSDTMPR